MNNTGCVCCKQSFERKEICSCAACIRTIACQKDDAQSLCVLCISQCFAIMFAHNAYSLRTRGFHLEAKDGWREIQRRLCHVPHACGACACIMCVHPCEYMVLHEGKKYEVARHALQDDVHGLRVFCVTHCFIQSCLLITHIRSEQGFFIWA